MYILSGKPIELRSSASASASANTFAITSAQRITLLLHGAALLAMVVGAGSAIAGTHDAQARYKAEKAICLSGQSHQDQATCLKEAGAVLAQSRTHRTDSAPGDYNQNSLLRCNPLPADQRDACRRRIEGEGSTSGSVEAGGLLREVVTPDKK